MMLRLPMPAPRSLARAVMLAALVALAGHSGGCGASRQESPRPDAPGARDEAPVPADPLQLVPAHAQRVASVDIDALRGSSLLASLQRWAGQHACLAPNSLEWILQRASRAIVASFDDPQAPQATAMVAVVIGRFGRDDPSQLLRIASSALGAPAASITQSRRGPHAIWENGEWLAASLGTTAIAIGRRTQLLALLDVADRRAPAWPAGSELAHTLDAGAWLAAHTIAVAGDLPATAQQRMQRGLAEIGGRRLGVGVTRGAVALTVSAHQTLARARIVYPDATTASDAARQVMPVLNRTGFVLRLLGAPLPLERTKVALESARMDLSLTLDELELAGLLERLDWVLDASGSQCGVTAEREPGAHSG